MCEYEWVYAQAAVSDDELLAVSEPPGPEREARDGDIPAETAAADPFLRFAIIL